MLNEIVSQDTAIIVLHQLFGGELQERPGPEKERIMLLRLLINQLTVTPACQKSEGRRSQRRSYRCDETGEQQYVIESVVAYCSSAVLLIDEEVAPIDWALLQCVLSIAYIWRVEGKKSENLRQSIVCGQAALRLFTQVTYPFEWAATHMNLGEAYCQATVYADLQELYSGRPVMQEQAIRHFHAARKVYTQQCYPLQWARVQHCLGFVYHKCSLDI